METTTLEVGPTPRLRVSSAGGDLRLTGRGGTALEAQAPPMAGLSVAPTADGAEVRCASACLLFVPESAAVEVDTVAGDVRVTGLKGALTLGTAAGDVNLRRVGPVRAARVGGDLVVHRLEGDLRAEWIGGDVDLDHVWGAVEILAVEGDLTLRAVDGPVRAQVGGDAEVELSPPPDTTSSIAADGDLSCSLPESTAVELRLRAGGTLEARVRGRKQQDNQEMRVEMEGARAAAVLIAGGDLWVTEGGVEREAAPAGLRAEIEAEVDAALSQAEASLGDLGRFHGLYAERMRDRVRRTVERHRRRAERMRQRAERTPAHIRATLDLGSWMAGKTRVSDAERLAVLQMLEQGVIGVEEAEKLLRALEGQA